MTLTGLRERRREMAILRSVEEPPLQMFLLLTVVAVLRSFLGAPTGSILLYSIILIGQPFIASRCGFYIPATPPGVQDLHIILLVIFFGFLAGGFPAYRACR